MYCLLLMQTRSQQTGKSSCGAHVRDAVAWCGAAAAMAVRGATGKAMDKCKVSACLSACRPPALQLVKCTGSTSGITHQQ